MWTANGQPIEINGDHFVLNGTVHPVAKLRRAEFRTEHGITSAPTPAPVDTRWFYGAGTPKPLADLKAMVKDAVKGECASKIELFAPMWKQMNDAVRLAALLSIPSRSPAEEAEYADINLRIARITSLRAHSNVLEAQVDACTFETIQTWQSSGWPE